MCERHVSLIILLLFPSLLVSQQEGLIARIENPGTYFQDSRKNWIGKTIYFLKNAENVEGNPYFDWYYDPADPVHSRPDPKELMFTRGVFEEVWTGQFHIKKINRNYWKQGFFWKVRLLRNGRSIYFWDDAESGPSNFGFVEDYQEAKRHVGEWLWNKARDILYKPGDSGVISLKNIEPVRLIEVRWGEFGNFPLKFIMQTKQGEMGYYLERNYSRFLKQWHTFDPRKNYPEWTRQQWNWIENRLLRSGMSREMVMLSWGEPAQKEIRYDEKGVGYEVWIYTGVKNRTYIIQFLDGKLDRVLWK